MKTFYLFLILFLSLGMNSIAQDTVRVNVLGKNMVTVVENGAKTDVRIGDSTIDISEDSEDTVKIRVGRKTVVIAEGHHGSSVKYDQLDDEEYEKWTGHAPKFKGHWSFFEMGVNSFANVDYTGYDTPNFMDLNHNKSMEVNINLFKLSFGLQERRNDIGIVTGLGLNFNDYRFANDYTIKNEEGYIVPVPITDEALQKTKLSTGYLTVPLLFEFHVPRGSGLWMSVGVIGGIKMGSHTKVKIDDVKTKDHDDFNISPFRGGATFRLGYKGVNLFGTYYFTQFFRDNRGPAMNPFTIGIGIINW
ncbi:MAG TPA: outer membrane beta-barrel protein [Prolixibacteraceae bacterium]|nr:outer membrane beta-barrel protein [Prolixibacteraceae bacterium]